MNDINKHVTANKSGVIDLHEKITKDYVEIYCS